MKMTKASLSLLIENYLNEGPAAEKEAANYAIDYEVALEIRNKKERRTALKALNKKYPSVKKLTNQNGKITVTMKKGSPYEFDNIDDATTIAEPPKAQAPVAGFMDGLDFDANDDDTAQAAVKPASKPASKPAQKKKKGLSSGRKAKVESIQKYLNMIIFGKRKDSALDLGLAIAIPNRSAVTAKLGLKTKKLISVDGKWGNETNKAYHDAMKVFHSVQMINKDMLGKRWSDIAKPGAPGLGGVKGDLTGLKQFLKDKWENIYQSWKTKKKDSTNTTDQPTSSAGAGKKDVTRYGTPRGSSGSGAETAGLPSSKM